MIMRLLSGFVFKVWISSFTWSTSIPSAPAQLRHCFPYTGPRSPFSSAHSSQMVTPCSRSQRVLVSPRRNHSSSTMIERRWSFLVVSSGKPSANWFGASTPWVPKRAASCGRTADCCLPRSVWSSRPCARRGHCMPGASRSSCPRSASTCAHKHMPPLVDENTIEMVSRSHAAPPGAPRSPPCT